MQFGVQGPVTLRRNIAYIVIIVVSAVLIYLFVIEEMRFFLVPSHSMAPTLVPSEYLITLKDDTYERGHIVVLKDPEEEGGYLVKRIVAVAGDQVSIQGGALFLNASYASEPYCMEPIDYEMNSFTVQAGEVFVLGDNRNWSIDSHNWNGDIHGSPDVRGVPLVSIVGRVHFVYLPLSHMRRIVSYPLTTVAEISPEPIVPDPPAATDQS